MIENIDIIMLMKLDRGWSGDAFINLFGSSLKNSFKNSIKRKETKKEKYCILDLI